MRPFLLPLFAMTFLTACGSGLPGPGAPTVGAEVPTEGYETYVTQHNGYSRIRRAYAQPGDAEILAQFEDSDPASPAGFRSLVDFRTTPVGNRVNAEIIVESETNDVIQRILRLTTDVEAFTPERVVAAGGEIVLSGSDYSLVRVGNGSFNSANQSDAGSLYLALNFDTETASIRILNRQLYFHTPTSQPQDLHRIDLLGENLPFNIRTGAFGGEITGEVYQLIVRLGSYTVPVSGTLLGQVGGAAPDNLVAGGVFEASGAGTAFGQPISVQVDGVFYAAN